MPRVLYFHGFASSPASSKIAGLRPLLEPEIELDTPDLNAPSFAALDFEAMVQRGLERAHVNPPDAITGSSLGCQVALEIVRRGVRVPLVLIAPAIGISEQWRTRLPPGDPIHVFNHALNAEAPIHRAFFEQMAEIDASSEPPPTRVTVIIGTNDESVPFARVEEVWQRWERDGLTPGSKFVTIAGGDHGLTAYVDVIGREIREAVGGRRID